MGEEALERSKIFVEAARELATEGGLEAVTLRPLLERSGLSRRAFYERFDGIDDVLVALYEETVRRGARIVRRRIEGIEDPREALRALVRAMASIALNSRSPTFIVAISSERSRLAERMPQELDEASAPLIDVIAEILERGMKTGVVRKTNGRELAATLHSVLASEIHRNANLRGRGKAWVDDLCDFCLSGVADRRV